MSLTKGELSSFGSPWFSGLKSHKPLGLEAQPLSLCNSKGTAHLPVCGFHRHRTEEEHQLFVTLLVI